LPKATRNIFPRTIKAVATRTLKKEREYQSIGINLVTAMW
jgi:hypothetical protein